MIIGIVGLSIWRLGGLFDAVEDDLRIIGVGLVDHRLSVSQIERSSSNVVEHALTMIEEP